MDPTQSALTPRDLQQLASMLRELSTTASRTTSAYLANKIAVGEMSGEIEKFVDQISKGRDVSNISSKEMERAIKAKRDEIRLAKELQTVYSKVAEEVERYGESHDRVIKAREELARMEQRHAAQKAKTHQASVNASEELDIAFTDVGRGSKLTNAALVWFGSTLSRTSAQIASQYRANNGIVEGSNNIATSIDAVAGFMWDQQKKALALGLDNATQLASIANANRQLVNAMGGTVKSFDGMDEPLKRLRIVTGSSEDGVKQLLGSMRDLAEKGVRPTASAINQYTTDLTKLSQLTGQTVEQSRQMYDSVLGDIEVTDQLRSARADERDSILATQRAMIASSIALGKLPQQAIQAAQALNKIAGAKPIDRLKQAAKIRALGGAMGIAGSNEAADAVIAGKRMTPQQRQQLEDFMGKAANASDQSAANGLQSEIFTSTLLDKLDMEQYLGKGSPFSTTLNSTLANNTKLMESSDSKLASTVDWLNKIHNQITSIVSGNFLGGAVAAGGLALLSTKFKGATGAISGAISKLGSLVPGAGGAASAVAGAPGAAAPVSGVASKLATVGRMAGTAARATGVVGAGIDVGIGLNDLINGKAQKELPDGWDKLSPMKWMMYIGDKVNTGISAALGGDSLGSKIYDWTHDAPSSITTPMPSTSKKALKTEMQKADNGSDTLNAVKQGVKLASTQIDKIDSSNTLLKTLTDLTQKQLELAEKQLVATTLSDKDKSDSNKKGQILKDNKFASQYNYVS